VSGYYELLGIERKLALDPSLLQKRFYELSRELHPDRFARKSERERQDALDVSSRLNDAYRTLRDPIQRAMYVLSEEGFPIGEQRGADVPPELLEEVFDLNMALQELRGGDDSARPQLEAARENFGRMLSETGAQIEDLFAEWDGNGSKATLGEIRGVLNRRKYIQNLVNEVEKELSGPAA
jgi:molecular chaperone HscB